MITKEYRIGDGARPFLELNYKLRSSSHCYVITEQIGKGGSSLVYRARIQDDTEDNGKFCIVKEFYPSAPDFVASDRIRDGYVCVFPSGKEWFEENMKLEKDAYKLAQGLLSENQRSNDPHCWNYIDLFEKNNTLYQVCYDEQGDSFGNMLDSGRIASETLRDCVKLLLSVLPAVRPVHRQGYVHCDLKPSNLFMVASEPPIFRCIDFGSAVRYGSDMIISSSYEFAAPEIQFRNNGEILCREINGHVDYSFDTYSLVAMLYKIATGKTPKNWSVITGKLTWEEERFFDLSDEALEKANKIFEKGISSNSQDRYASLEELETDLKKLLNILERPVYLRSFFYKDYFPAVSVSQNFCEKIDEALDENCTYIYFDSENAMDACSHFFAYCREKRKRFRLVPIAFRENLLETLSALPFGRQLPETKFSEGMIQDYMQDMTGDYYVLIMGYRYVPGDESLLSRLRNNKGGHFLLFGSKPTVEEREHRMGVTIQMELFQPVPGMEGKEERIVQFLAKSRPHGLKMSYLKKLPDVDLRNLETLFRERVLYMLGDTCYLNPNVSIKFTEEESAEFSDTLMKVILDTVSSKRERLSLEDFRLCCRLFRQLPCKTHTVALLSQLYVCVGNTEDIYSERLKGLYVKLFERFKNENQGQMYVLGDSLREFVSFFKKSGDMVGDLKEYRLILFEVTRQPSWSVALDMKNKRYDRVIETSTMLIELFSYYGKEFEKPIAEYYCLRGKAFRSLKKYDEAVSDFSQAISLQPKNAEFWNERGNTFYKFNQYQDSISDFSQAISLCASDARYWYNRGYSLYCLGKYEEAISDNKKAIYISPDFAPAWGQLGCAFMELGNKKEAIEAFSKSIDLNPDDINVRLARGLTLHNLKQYKEAILDLIQVVSFQPDCVKAWSYLGYCLLSLKEYEEASFKFSQAISFNPNDFKNWYMRAVCYFRMKRYREAISDFSQTLILNPREEMAYYNRSICYKALGDEESLKKAQEDYEIYLKLEQSNNF